MAPAGAQKKSPERLDTTPKPPTTLKRPTVIVTAPRLGSLVVSTDIPGAEIRVEGIGRRMKPASVLADEQGGATFDNLAPGHYRVSVLGADYDTSVEEAQVVAGKSTRVSAHLTPRFGTLMLAGSDLAFATGVWVDGAPHPVQPVAPGGAEPDPIRIRVTPGEHDVRVEAAARAAFTKRVRVEAGAEEALAVAMPVVPGAVRVSALPASIVYVDDVETGVLPSEGDLVVHTSGGVEHRIRVERDGYESVADHVAPTPGEEVRFRANQKRRPTSGAFADAFIGGLGLWNAPPEWTTDDSGVLHVRGSHAGIAKGAYYDDFDLTFGLRLVDGHGAGWVLRSNERGDGYLFLLTGPSASPANRLRVFAMKNGSFDPASPAFATLPVEPGLVAGADYIVQVHVEGHTVRTWITPSATGTKVSIGHFEDGENRFTTGGLGFDGVAGAFDVFTVEARPAGELSKAKP